MDQLDPLSAANEAVARISAARRLRRNGRLYSGDDAAARLNQGALGMPTEPAPLVRPIALVPLSGAYETPAPLPTWGAPPHNPLSLYSTAQANAPKIEAAIAGGGVADPWMEPFHPRQQQVAPPTIAAPQLLLPPGRTADHALNAQAVNGLKIESAIAGGGVADPWMEPFHPRQQQVAPPTIAAPQLLLPPGRTADRALKIESAIGGGVANPGPQAAQIFAPQPVVALSGIRRPVADPATADPAALRQPAPHIPLGYEQSGGNVLDAALNAAGAIADPILADVSGGGPGTSTAKGNQLINAKLQERLDAVLGRATAGSGRVQMPLTTGFRAGDSAAAANPAEDLIDAVAAQRPDAGPATAARAARNRDTLLAAIRKGAGDRARAAGQVLEPAFGPVDLGAGRAVDRGMQQLAKGTSGQLSHSLRNLGRGARVLLPAAAAAAPLIPVAMGAADGYSEAGAGGALIQGGSAALGGIAGGAMAGALAGSVVPGFGTVIGGILGGLGGMALGKGLTSAAQGAVDAAKSGDTGVIGQLGKSLDPMIDTATERQQREVMREINSPANQLIRQQQEERQARARADMATQLYLQSLN